MKTLIEFILLATNLPVTHALIGEAIGIRVSGLPAHAEVLLVCDNSVTKAEAVFKSDDHGVVNLAEQAPLCGSYPGIDYDGMFWSRTPIPAVSPDHALGPFACKVFLENKLIAAAHLQKQASLPGITNTRLSLAEHGFEAQFSLPAGKGPFPALLVLGGSEGGLDTFMAEYFASIGFATLSVAYHGMPGLPPYINQIPLEYFKKAIDWLKAQPSVKSNHLGVIGNSRGAEAALVLASTYHEFSAVISCMGSGLAWAGDYEKETGKSTSSWTYQGQDVSAISFLGFDSEKEILPDGREAVSYSRNFLNAMKNESAVLSSMIPVEKIQAPILFLAGKDDKIWPSFELSEIAVKRRAQFKVPYKDTFKSYENAGHALGIPGWPTMDPAIYHPIFNEYWNLGGTPAGNAKAQRESWAEVIQFLRAAL